MKVLVACEMSGRVREAFRKLGHDAYSCDILPSEIPSEYHIQDDIMNHLNDGWDMMIAHPDCQYLCVTGNKWMKPEFKERFPDREKQRHDAIEFFLRLFNSNIEKICVENPVGIMSTVFRKPDQYVHPYHFGENHSKKTGLWLKNLPKLRHTKIVKPEFYKYKDGRNDPMWHVMTMKLKPEERRKERSRTFKSIADAMASQWGILTKEGSQNGGLYDS